MKKVLLFFVFLGILILPFANGKLQKDRKNLIAKKDKVINEINYFELVKKLSYENTLKFSPQVRVTSSKNNIKFKKVHSFKKVQRKDKIDFISHIGPTSARLPKNLKKGTTYMEIGHGAISLSFKPIAVKTTKKLTLNSIKGIFDDNKVLYENSFTGISEEFISQGNKLKHNIYVKPEIIKGADNFLYSWEIPIVGDIQLEVGKQLMIKDFTTDKDITVIINGKPAYKILRSFAYLNRTKKIYGSYTISFEKNAIILTMSIPMEKFQKAKRIIKIDPTVIALSYSEIWGSYKRSIAMDSKGILHLVYYDDNVTYEIYYVKSTDGGNTWSSPKKLSSSNFNAYYPAIAIDDDDNIYVVWEDDLMYEVGFAKSTDGGNTWTEQKYISQTQANGAYRPSITAKGSGKIFVVFYSYFKNPGNAEPYFLKSIDGGETWEPEKQLATTLINDNSRYSYYVSIEKAPNGKIGMVWVEKKYSRYIWAQYIESLDDGLTWSDIQQIYYTYDSSSADIRDCSLAFDQSNYPHVVFCARKRNDWGSYHYRIIYTNFNGVSWSQPQFLNDNLGNDSYSPNISSDNNGTIYLAWNEINNILFRKRTNGAWSSPSLINYDAYYPNMPSYFDLTLPYGGPFIVFVNEMEYQNGIDWNGEYGIVFRYLGNSEPLPDTPTLIYPDNNYSNGYFAWKRVVDASGVVYKLQISSDASFNNIIDNDDEIKQNEYYSHHLQADEQYYVRVKTIDLQGNESSWSNPIFFTADITPPLTIATFSNSDAATGWWNIEYPLTVTLNAQDSGPSGIKNTFFYMDKDEIVEDSYNWIDIEEPENKLPISQGTDDEKIKGIPLGFQFPIGNETFSQVGIDTNGRIFFGSSSYYIYAYNDDLQANGDGTSSIYVARLDNPKRFVITYKNWGYYWLVDSHLNFQVVLYDTGRVDWNIKNGTQDAYYLYIGIKGYSNIYYDKYDGANEGLLGPISLSYEPSYTGPINITDQSISQIAYNSLDNAGNIENINTFSLSIDYTRPYADITKPENDITINTTNYTISGNATDDKSGVDTVQYSINTNTPIVWYPVSNLNGNSWSTTVDLNSGTNIISVRAIDVAGNVQIPTQTLTITVNESNAYTLITDPINEQKMDVNDFPYNGFGTSSDGTVYSAETIAIGIKDENGNETWTYSTTLMHPDFTFNLPFPGEGRFYLESRAEDITNDWKETPNPGVWLTIGEDPKSSISDPVNDQFIGGSTYFITGIASDVSSTVENIQIGIKGSNDSDYTWHLTNGTPTWYYTWNLPQNIEGVYELLSRATDSYNNVEKNTSSIMVKVDTVDPKGEIIDPIDGSNISNLNYTVKGTAFDNYSGVSKVELFIKKSDWTTHTSTIASGTNNWTATPNFPETGTYSLWLDVYDNGGNKFTSDTITTSVYPYMPTSMITTPINNDTIYSEFYTIKGQAQTFSGGPSLTKVEVGITPEGGTTQWFEANGTINWAYSWQNYSNGNYTIQSRAIADTYTEMSSNGISIHINISYPPSSLKLTGHFGEYIKAEWNASTAQNVHGYALFRKTDDTDYILITKTNSLSYTDYNVLPNIKYTYSVATIGGDDVIGQKSEGKSITLSKYGNSLDDIVIYPNPVIGKEITFVHLTKNITIEIYNIEGAKIFTITPNNDHYKWNLLNLNDQRISTGIYIAVLKDGKNNKFIKFAVIK